MPGPEMMLAFLAAALTAGGLSLGGVTLVYFLDKHRVDRAADRPSSEQPPPADRRSRAAS